MKILIAVVNANSRVEWKNAIRHTWAPLMKPYADVFFFTGRGPKSTNEIDEIQLDCDDSYQGLPDKIRAIAKWAYDNGYDYFLKCDDDVILRPEGLMTSGFDKHEYSGRANRPPNNLDPYWVPVGFNYWVSRKCMPLIAAETLPENSNDDEKWVACTLHKHQIHLQDDQRYRLYYGTTVERPLRAPKRPLRPDPNRECMFPDTFSWCIFLEGNSGNRIPVEYKISEFHKVFAMSRGPQDVRSVM